MIPPSFTLDQNDIEILMGVASHIGLDPTAALISLAMLLKRMGVQAEDMEIHQKQVETENATYEKDEATIH
jgi:hypothetical protein